MASSPRNCSFPVSLKALLLLLLLSSLLAMTAASQVANAQIEALIVFNNMSQPLKVSITPAVPGSTVPTTVLPNFPGILILNASHPWEAMLFQVGQDTYELVSDKNLDQMFCDTPAGLTMTVSGPPCVCGKAGLQTVTAAGLQTVTAAALKKNSVAKCAEKKK